MTPELSIVVPFLNEEQVLPLLRQRLDSATLPDRRELVLVSDGSTDGSVAFVEGWIREDPRVRLIELTRNFGHQPAFRAGLDAAVGDTVAFMDADLQDTPEDLARMHQELRHGGLDVVYAVRRSRDSGPLKRLAYRAYYRLYGLLSDHPFDRDAGDFCVLSRRAADMLKAFPERVQYLRGLRSWIGLKSKPFPLDRPERAAGRSRYTLAKLMTLAANGIFSFSAAPLRLATAIGVVLCVLSMALAGGYLLAWAVYDVHIKAPGFTTLAIIILFLSGVQMLMLGVIGEYIRQIFLEAKGRPVYLVARTLNDPK